MRDKSSRSKKSPAPKPSWRQKWGIDSGREKRLEQRRAERKREASEIRDRVLARRAQEERERRELAKQDQTPTERLEFLDESSHIFDDESHLHVVDSPEEVDEGAASETPKSQGKPAEREETGPHGETIAHPKPDTPPERAGNDAGASHKDERKGRAAKNTGKRNQPTERKVIVLRPPKGWPRIILSAAEVAVISWGILVAIALGSFLLTAENPWMLETDWQGPIGIGADAWAMSYGAPILAGGAVIRMVPLLLTALQVVLARAGIYRARAASWQGSFLFVPAYIAFVELLSFFTQFHAQRGWLALGGFLVALAAWLWSLKSRDLGIALAEGAKPYFRGIRDGLIATGLLALAGLVTLIVAIASGWSRILGIQDLLNASVPDLIFAWLAQLMFLPNAVAWAASWITGPGFYTGADAIITPSRADVTAIPAIPVMGAFPRTEIGIWVVLIPIALGIAFSTYLIWKRREERIVDHLIHAGLLAVTMLVVTTAWMWLSTGALGVARMSLLGPRWVYAALFATLEIGLTAALIYALAHPLLLAKYVAGGRWAKASTIATVGSVSEKIQSRKQKSEVHEDAAEPSGSAEDAAPSAQGEGTPDVDPAEEEQSPDSASEEEPQDAGDQRPDPAPDDEPASADAEPSGDLENESCEPTDEIQVDESDSEDKTGKAHA